MLLQGHEVVEGVDPVEFAGVDQAHVDVAHPGPRKRYIGQRVFAVEDGRLEPPLRDVVVQRRTRDREETGQGLPAELRPKRPEIPGDLSRLARYRSE